MFVPDLPIPRRTRLFLVLFTLFPMLLASCGGGNAAQRRSVIQGLDSEIGFATVDDLIPDLGPPQQSTDTPEGIWYTWRKGSSGAVSGGFSVGFFGITVGAPTETGEELNCLFDRDTGRLKNYRYREW
jgi:hypothetical protein